MFCLMGEEGLKREWVCGGSCGCGHVGRLFIVIDNIISMGMRTRVFMFFESRKSCRQPFDNPTSPKTQSTIPCLDPFEKITAQIQGHFILANDKIQEDELIIRLIIHLFLFGEQKDCWRSYLKQIKIAVRLSPLLRLIDSLSRVSTARPVF
jgi:hypothetical protein